MGTMKLHIQSFILSVYTSCISFYVVQGVANRGASIRVGRDTEKEGKGYFEDRRPASNMDPYVVTSMIAETTILWNP
ncbi:Glutamine synthetase cytosolic isozyme 1-1 [Capsicum chinense]|nr:Glutamine synthetase cytosolic isozyme 1-1 [Capsicum chinense]